MKSFRNTVCEFWPTGVTGAGSIPARHSGEMLQLAESLSSELETTVGVKLSKEVVMEAGNSIQTTRTIVSTTGRLTFKIGVIVAVVAGCLLAVPLTRAYKHYSETRA